MWTPPEEDLRPMDWQDKVVFWSAIVACFILLCILIWGR